MSTLLTPYGWCYIFLDLGGDIFDNKQRQKVTGWMRNLLSVTSGADNYRRNYEWKN